ncbi:TniB NTP-binding protein [Georgfuchsia toluolica]|uniref:TniB NTP-binding protein n=1 Tax=Georgfuchsia toluolica TaxID=424218 RepID=A0A916J5S4_9PROT|nr:TniB NTP-binding protein [Georgfuchsia toluolica]
MTTKPHLVADNGAAEAAEAELAMRYPHLREQSRAMADADAETRIWAIQAGYRIPYRRSKEILERMEELLAHPPIDRMPNLLIVACSNNGKTNLLRRFMDNHPPDQNPEGEAAIVPAVMVRLSSPDIG